MLLPSALTTGAKGNPLLNLGGLELPARVLIAYYSSEPAQSDIESFSPSAATQVSMEESTRGPIIAVDVKDSTPDGAIRVLHYVAESIPENLSRIQEEVGSPTRAAIGSMPLVLDVEAKRDSSLVVRLVVASVVAMLTLTFFVIFLLDGISMRRIASEGDAREGIIDEATSADNVEVGMVAGMRMLPSDEIGTVVESNDAVSAQVGSAPNDSSNSQEESQASANLSPPSEVGDVATVYDEGVQSAKPPLSGAVDHNSIGRRALGAESTSANGSNDEVESQSTDSMNGETDATRAPA